MGRNTDNDFHAVGIPGSLFSAALLLFANLFLFATFSVYSGSPEEFDVSFKHMLASQQWIFALVFLLLLLPGLIRSRSFADKYLSLIFVLGVLTWVQANILLWDYGVFDGRDFSWEQYDIYGWLDIALWFSLIYASLRYANRILPMVVFVSWILLLGQAVVIYSLPENTEGELKKDHAYEASFPEEFFDLSSKQNISHFILDSFQTDIFLQLVEEGDLFEEFSGFTLFYENAAVTPHTSFAIPAIFSGKLFDGSQSPAAYYKTSIQNGFQNTLYNKGYTVNLIPKMSMRSGNFSNYYRVSSNYHGTANDLKRQNAAQLVDVALFRSAPHFLRKLIFDGGNWMLVRMFSDDHSVDSITEKSFLKDYIDGTRVGSEAPAYHFIHIKPPHPPYVTLADGSYAGEILPNTRENFLNESRAVLELMRQYVAKLKKLGVYDNALIILQGDHGSEINPVVDGKEIDMCLPRLPALLAVKPPGAVGNLTISNTQTSILDIAPTILAYAGGATTSVFELDPDLLTSRPFIRVNAGTKETRVSYYSINGSIYDPDSCIEDEKLLVSIEKPVYEYGTKIKFGMTGNGDSILGTGWSACDSRFCWSNGHLSTLQMTVNESSADLDMHVRLIPLIKGVKIPRQRIKVLINGVQLTQWLATERKAQDFTLRIPAGAVTGNQLEIGFELPDAVRPNTLQLGGDRRMLGIALASLQIDIADQE